MQPVHLSGRQASSALCEWIESIRCAAAGTMPGSHLALPTRWQIAYYSCPGFRETRQACRVSIKLSGPRGIRTLDLLNAIETRSQLRYGPLIDC
jgi:hypothetical protein